MKIPKLAAVVAGLAVVLALVPGHASGTFPGNNGVIAMIGAEIETEDEQGNSTCAFNNPPELYTMDAEGSDIQVLRDVDGYAGKPSWSSDGNRIAFGIDDGPDGLGIFTVASDGSDLQTVIDEEPDEHGPAWSPDGSRVAYARGWRRRGGNNIWTVRLNGSESKQLTSHKGEDVLPAWSPDGRRIAFASTRRGGGYDIYAMNRRGANTQRVTKDATVRIRPNGSEQWGGLTTLTWSPDGRWILFEANKGDGAAFIYKVRPDGSRKVRLEEGRYPTWSPDGTKILFKGDVTSGRCTPDLYEMRPNGEDVRKLETRDDVEIYFLDWQPQ